MKTKAYPFYILLILASVVSLTGCEDVIDLKTETGPAQLVVDGWITDQAGPQTIRLTLSAAYFNNGPATTAVGAQVLVTDNEGTEYPFSYNPEKKAYQWTPPQDTVVLGHIGRTYTLTIQYEGETYVATNQINRVPPIDSLVYEEEKFPIKPDKGPQEGYIAQFYARDFLGLGDTYWIKPLKGGKLNGTEASAISLAFDGAFSPGSPSDGLIFIQPLRQSITVNGLFSAGDTAGVELHSITPETYYFLLQVRQESANGGIFAVPPANIPTNIRNTNGKQALGFFGASAVSRAETVIDPRKAKPKS
jgi:hypothetical protein